MPTKRNRRTRGRVDDLDAWNMLFSVGRDYFGDLDRAGFDDEDAKLDAAEDAWQRLGARFMATWLPEVTVNRSRPWALEAFGPPPGWKG